MKAEEITNYGLKLFGQLASMLVCPMLPVRVPVRPSSAPPKLHLIPNPVLPKPRFAELKSPGSSPNCTDESSVTKIPSPPLLLIGLPERSACDAPVTNTPLPPLRLTLFPTARTLDDPATVIPLPLLS